MNKNRIENGIEIINYAINNNTSLTSSSVHFGFSGTYCKNIKASLLENGEDNVLKKEFLNLYNDYLTSKPKLVINEPSVVKSKDLDVDDSYDKRSKYWCNRDSNEHIQTYGFEILLRDEKPFTGELTRTQMETIYANYPYVTQNTVSQFFPYLNFTQFKKILRLFNITKDKIFPQHLIEELDETKLGELALKNKENAAYKKFIETKNKFYESELRKLQSLMFNITENDRYIENMVDKLLGNYFETNDVVTYKYDNKIVRKESDIIYENIYFSFGDIHFGKHFKDTKFGRGVDKEILKDRCMEIAKEVVIQANQYKSKKIILNVLGDIFESILPDGMHPEHHKRMDLIGDKQMEHGLDVFEEMIDYIQNNTIFDVNIYVHCVGGNHDRIQENRDQDKRRTATAIFFTVLKKLMKLKKYENVNIYEAEDGIISYSYDDISVIAFHGDSGLYKSKAIDIINLFKTGNAKNYTVILNGHWHSLKLEEGVNYKRITCGSVCSADEYVQNELGKGAQPSYLIMKKSKGFGVDIEIKTLY